jgi:RimJ/RimL family protein N-acetyltransferase
MTTHAAAAASRSPARVRLRPTMQSDLEFVLSLEGDPENLPFITPWERTQHEAAIRFPDFRHFIVEAGPGLHAAGFLILVGCRGPHRSLELKRMVVGHKGQGIGRAALRLAKKTAFDELGAHRFWLHVKRADQRARSLYDSEGFVAEGELRDALRVPGGFESLVVMSMLASEFARRRADALELPA